MTTLYAIFSVKRLPSLFQRRIRYAEVMLEGKFCYAFEALGVDPLGRRKGNLVEIQDQFLADINLAAAGDPNAFFFVADLRNRESVLDAIQRCLKTPLQEASARTIVIDDARFMATSVSASSS